MLHVQLLRGQGQEEEEKHAKTQRPIDILPGTQMNVRTRQMQAGQPLRQCEHAHSAPQPDICVHTGNRVELL